MHAGTWHACRRLHACHVPPPAGTSTKGLEGGRVRRYERQQRVGGQLDHVAADVLQQQAPHDALQEAREQAAA
jgi:hypothetical protein